MWSCLDSCEVLGVKKSKDLFQKGTELTDAAQCCKGLLSVMVSELDCDEAWFSLFFMSPDT